ncbi:ABC transporter permease [Campylobacter corcagiensis]|uniref:ABC transporter permease n=1 Tax=Campylobacter corcagiensis TaxID=1448857 RepID=A0A7M1LH25_9BACT|nr:ABC transporter permease [Campylobacter corcagiensis]QKF64699.1 ferrirhodotorulic acid ABC transporter, permease protein [Campylobacter corcagiensis]QOQ87136.1 ABC transporter permease [Campylobacter corcagiensis]
MIFKIILSSIRGDMKILSFLTIFLTSLLISSMLNITLSIGNVVSKELRSYGSNILVLPKGNSLSIDVGDQKFEPLKNENYINESDLHAIKEIFWRNNIVGFAPFLTALVDDKKIVGTYFDKNVKVTDEEDFTTGIKAIYPFWKIDGKLPKDDSLDEVLVGSDLALKENLKLNDEINIAGKTLKVVGILDFGGEFSNKFITSLKFTQTLLNLENKVEKVEVSALTIPENDLAIKARKNLDYLDQVEYDLWYCTAFVSSIAYQISEDLKGADAKPQTQISDAESSVVTKIQTLMLVVSLISLIVSSIAISSLMTSEIYRRTKEIGLLKALGATNFQIYLNFALGSVVVAVFSSLVGVIFGYLISQIIAYFIFSHFINFSLIVIPITLFFAVLIALIGSLLPMKNVINLLPAEVLYASK